MGLTGIVQTRRCNEGIIYKRRHVRNEWKFKYAGEGVGVGRKRKMCSREAIQRLSPCTSGRITICTGRSKDGMMTKLLVVVLTSLQFTHLLFMSRMHQPWIGSTVNWIGFLSIHAIWRSSVSLRYLTKTTSSYSILNHSVLSSSYVGVYSLIQFVLLHKFIHMHFTFTPLVLISFTLILCTVVSFELILSIYLIYLYSEKLENSRLHRCLKVKIRYSRVTIVDAYH